MEFVGLAGNRTGPNQCIKDTERDVLVGVRLPYVVCQPRQADD